MKFLVAFIGMVLMASCAPTSTPRASVAGVFPISGGELWMVRFETTPVSSFDFSLEGAAITDTDNWIYANLKTSLPAFGGSGAVPDDRKSLVMVFNLDAKGTLQQSCVVPLGADISKGAKGQGAGFLNDRKVSSFACAVELK